MDKFKIGEIVKHKISNERYVILEIYPIRWFRKTITYFCHNGTFNYERSPRKFFFKEVELSPEKGK